MDRWVRRAYFWQSRDTILRAASEAVTRPSREKESEEEIEKEREREEEEPETKTKDKRNMHVTTRRDGGGGGMISEKDRLALLLVDSTLPGGSQFSGKFH